MPINFSRGPALGFMLRFGVIFGLLIAPWPRLNQLYSQYFQALGGMAFGPSAGSDRVVIFESASGHNAGLDTRITLENTALLGSDGKGAAKSVEVDSRSIGWVPTALTMALVLATPIPWKRRLAAFAGGIVLIHLFIYFTVQSWVWNASAMTLSAFWQRAAGELNYALMNQMGASFTVPVLVWILVTFRRQDALAD
jgi:hypothetical protein